MRPLNNQEENQIAQGYKNSSYSTSELLDLSHKFNHEATLKSQLQVGIYESVSNSGRNSVGIRDFAKYEINKFKFKPKTNEFVYSLRGYHNYEAGPGPFDAEDAFKEPFDGPFMFRRESLEDGLHPTLPAADPHACQSGSSPINGFAPCVAIPAVQGCVIGAVTGGAGGCARGAAGSAAKRAVTHPEEAR